MGAALERVATVADDTDSEAATETVSDDARELRLRLGAERLKVGAETEASGVAVGEGAKERLAFTRAVTAVLLATRTDSVADEALATVVGGCWGWGGRATLRTGSGTLAMRGSGLTGWGLAGSGWRRATFTGFGGSRRTGR